MLLWFIFMCFVLCRNNQRHPRESGDPSYSDIYFGWIPAFAGMTVIFKQLLLILKLCVKVITCGCHLTCPTEQNIIQAGFKFQEITRQSMRGVPPIVRPCIRGKAVKSN
jgi:hypothetical protein